MWTAVVGILTTLVGAIPKVLDYLKFSKVIGKDKDDKEDREKDMEHVKNVVIDIEEIVDDGKIDDINDKFGWKN